MDLLSQPERELARMLAFVYGGDTNNGNPKHGENSTTKHQQEKYQNKNDHGKDDSNELNHTAIQRATTLWPSVGGLKIRH